MIISQTTIELKKYKEIRTKEELYTHLQYAAIVELSTIPPYLTALYSLKDKTSKAFQIIRSVVMEEMLHLNLVCNLINAIGYKPQLVHPFPDPDRPGRTLPNKTISYPTNIPHHHKGGPFIVLMPASKTLMQNTFMAIEQPAKQNAPSEGDKFKTIGQLYAAIEEGFKKCVEIYGDGHNGLFKDDTECQHTKYYFGSSGGRAIKIKDLKTALRACEEIKKQGEGAPNPKNPENWEEDFGYYEYYGDRQDGTYGPILGTPVEMSHYLKFKDMAEGKIPLGDVYPMMPNPHPDNFTHEHTKELASIFDGCYSMMLRTLELCFSRKKKPGSSEEREPDPFFTIIVPLMKTIFPAVATRLMQLPVLPSGDANLGPNAGPCFEYTDQLDFETIREKVNELKSNLDREIHQTASPDKENSLLAFQQDIKSVQQSLDDMRDKMTGTFLIKSI